MTAQPSVTNTIQLSTFSIIQSILSSYSSLSSKFTSSHIFDYDPKEKAAGFTGFPYIVVDVPTTSTDLLVLDHSTTMKEFEVEIKLVVEYLAKSNYLTYANGIISAIEAAEQTFIDSGYNNVQIDLLGTDGNYVVHEKECIQGTFRLTLTGTVWR
jgi:hypothetical protein